MPSGQIKTTTTTTRRARPPLLFVAAHAPVSPLRWSILILAGAAVCASAFLLGAALLTKRVVIVRDPAYHLLVRDRLTAASASNEQALARYQFSLDQVMAKHQPRLDAMTKEAVKLATERQTLYPMLGYLARDQILHTNKTEQWLHERIGQTTVDPVLQELLDDIALEADQLQSELNRETAKLAYDIAAKGSDVSPQRLRAKAHTDFAKLFVRPAADAGREGTAPVLLFAVFDAPVIARIGARVFARPIARLVLIPAIATADGPLPVGDMIAIVLAVLSAWDLYKLDAQFQQDVSDSLKRHLDQFQKTALRESKNFGGITLAAVTRQQAEIAADAAGVPVLKGLP